MEGSAVEMESEEFLMVWMNGDMETGVLQVDNYEPVSLRKQRDNRVQCKHAEFKGRYETVEVSEIKDGAEASIFFRNSKVF